MKGPLLATPILRLWLVNYKECFFPFSDDFIWMILRLSEDSNWSSISQETTKSYQRLRKKNIKPFFLTPLIILWLLILGPAGGLQGFHLFIYFFENIGLFILQPPAITRNCYLFFFPTHHALRAAPSYCVADALLFLYGCHRNISKSMPSVLCGM